MPSIEEKIDTQLSDDSEKKEVAEGSSDSAVVNTLRALGLKKRYGSRWVVQNVSLEVKSGEVVGLLGPNGAGKTTTAGKLALRLKNEDKARPLFIAADVYRPAAITQLKQVADQIDVPVFEKGTDVDPVEIVRQGMEVAKQNHNDYVSL